MAKKKLFQSLIQDDDTDFTMTEKNGSVWITVGKKSIYILRKGKDVKIAIFPLGKEAEDPIAEISA